MPKTLIFAKDDHHAEEITQIAREVFGKGNEFCRKITYKASTKPEALLKEFQTGYNPRIAVTVDMIATGTDVKPLEVLIFMRDVGSENYFEQMRGRGVRTLNPTDLRQVTPDAKAKDRFVLIDAVGVTESRKAMAPPLERKRAVAFDKLLQSVASGDTSEDTLSSLAGRLAALAPKLTPEDQQRVRDLAGGKDVAQIAGELWRAVDPDTVEAEATVRGVFDEAGREAVGAELRATAARVLGDAPKLRKLLNELKQLSEIVIDDISTDAVLSAGFDVKLAEQKTTDFRRFIEQNKDELTALQILYERPYAQQRLTWQAVKDLRDAMARPPWLLEPAALWACYRRLNASKVREPSAAVVLADLVSLVRYALGQSETLQPLSMDAAGRFNLWIGREKRAGRDYTEEQIRWLTLIRDHVAANVEVTLEDMQEVPAFADQGGRIAANKLFGKERLPTLLGELSDTLIGTAQAA